MTYYYLGKTLREVCEASRDVRIAFLQVIHRNWENILKETIRSISAR